MFDACTVTTILVLGVIFASSSEIRASSGASAFITEYSAPRMAHMFATGRRTLLCSIFVVMTPSPGRISPERTLFIACVALYEKITFSCFDVPKRAHIPLLVSNTASADFNASACALLPGFPQYSFIHFAIDLTTEEGFGKVVAALSRYIIKPSP